MLNEDWQVESPSPGVDRWLHELPDGAWKIGRLPRSMLAVAGRALAGAEFTERRSRRQLVSSVFLAHYEPRVRDNEKRTVGGLPMRGGPVASAR